MNRIFNPIVLLLFLSFTAFLLFTCSETTKYQASYSHDIQPIFNTKCLDCHGSQGQNGLDLTNYETTMNRQSIHGTVVIPGDAENSLLFEAVSKPDNEQNRLTSRMPKGHDPLLTTQIQLIEDWINEGALNN